MVDKPTLGYLSIDIASPFGQILLRGVRSGCEAHGMNLFVVHGCQCDSPNGLESRRNILYRITAGRRFDGLLVSNIFSFVNKERIREFMGQYSGMPTVTMVEKLRGIPVVRADNAAGFRPLVTDLVTRGSGHTYAVITGPPDNVDSVERLEILREVMERHGIPLPAERVLAGTYNVASVTRAIHTFVDERGLSFDTLVCFNDHMAMAALDELRRRGLRVPEDVRITGFDNVDDSRFTVPPLTTVAYPALEMGAIGAQLVARLLAGEKVPETTVLPTRYVRRQSSGSPSRGVEECGRREAGSVAVEICDATDTLENYRDIIANLRRREREERYTAEFGEYMGAVFDLPSIPQILARYCRQLEIGACFVALYTDPTKALLKILARIENGVEVSPEGLGEFSPSELLPEPLRSAYPSLIMEALYQRNDDLGILLFSMDKQRSLLCHKLRNTISAAVKRAQLVTEISRYSEELESMVRRRTARMSELNEELRAEMAKREKAEKELLRSKNLESLGVLAGGIAHDFNNILTAISGSVSLLSMEDGDPAERRSLYTGISSAVENAKSLTRQLLTFSKGGVPIRKAMSILPLVRETAEFLLRGSGVKPVFRFGEGVGNTEIDPDQISQVINNLILNAKDAMPGGGTIMFAVDRVTAGPGAPQDVRPGTYVRISIADSGTGIPGDHLDRIFDPYFTTKERGSGLGLATSLAIVRRHGGQIVASSQAGSGAVFDVYLPSSEKEPEVSAANTPTAVPTGLRVLVLDDDLQVRGVLSAFLSRTGQEYVMTGEGSETVSLYAAALKSGARFDLVIADLTIPGGMGGSEAMSRILELDPEARGIVSSGYSDLPVLADCMRYGFRATLRKPFTFQEFLESVRHALRD